MEKEWERGQQKIRLDGSTCAGRRWGLSKEVSATGVSVEPASVSGLP